MNRNAITGIAHNRAIATAVSVVSLRVVARGLRC